MSCEKATGHSFSLIHHPAQAGSSCLRRGKDGATQIYQFYYDVFDNMTELKVGKSITSNNLTAGMTLAIYEYGSNNGLLEKQTYGNGDYITFTYDDLGRTKTATYSDGRVLTCHRGRFYVLTRRVCHMCHRGRYKTAEKVAVYANFLTKLNFNLAKRGVFAPFCEIGFIAVVSSPVT